MKPKFSVYRLDAPLTTPYVLSFGTVTSFLTCYVVVSAQGRTGVGEVTPLPGYSDETIDSVEASLGEAAESLRRGVPWREVVAGMCAGAPFAASGVACAFETWEAGPDSVFGPVSGEVPLSAFCAGADPAEVCARARELVGQGYRTLKMKVGAMTPDEDAARIRAVSGVLEQDARIRLDANQGYDFQQALEMCRHLEGIDRIELLEQPFGPHDWALHGRLCRATDVPIMLDESIWTPEDVGRAADCGAALVKFKLAKHPGMEGSRRMVEAARRHGLGIVYGNGVQGPVGNHLEAFVFAGAGLETASEGNGFLKMASSPVAHALRSAAGGLSSGGVGGLGSIARAGGLVAEALFETAM